MREQKKRLIAEDFLECKKELEEAKDLAFLRDFQRELIEKAIGAINEFLIDQGYSSVLQRVRFYNQILDWLEQQRGLVKKTLKKAKKVELEKQKEKFVRLINRIEKGSNFLLRQKRISKRLIKRFAEITFMIIAKELAEIGFKETEIRALLLNTLLDGWLKELKNMGVREVSKMIENYQKQTFLPKTKKIPGIVTPLKSKNP
jgi:hypothetical protein